MVTTMVIFLVRSTVLGKRLASWRWQAYSLLRTSALGNVTMLTSNHRSPLSATAVFADLALIAVERDQALDVAERKVRSRLRTLELQVNRTVASLLSEIGRIVESERRGQLGFTDQELTADIEGLSAGEADLRALLRSAEKSFRRLADVAAREGKGRRDLLRMAGREFARIAGHLGAALQEGRWMLIGVRDGREPREGGVIVSTPQELHRLLTLPCHVHSRR